MTTTALFSEKHEPFPQPNYQKKGGSIDVAFWRVPERLFDEPDELVAWARRIGGGSAGRGEAGAGAKAKVKVSRMRVECGASDKTKGAGSVS